MCLTDWSLVRRFYGLEAMLFTIKWEWIETNASNQMIFPPILNIHGTFIKGFEEVRCRVPENLTRPVTSNPNPTKIWKTQPDLNPTKLQTRHLIPEPEKNQNPTQTQPVPDFWLPDTSLIWILKIQNWNDIIEKRDENFITKWKVSIFHIFFLFTTFEFWKLFASLKNVKTSNFYT